MKKGMGRRIVVTGSRGKSSVVRLLHAGLNASGVATWSKITGVIPRELTPTGEQRVITRMAGAHVEEMRWWLKGLPREAVGVVLENSAVTPELQPLAARWLQPDVIVFTNTFPDHQEVWGPSSAGAAAVLAEGVAPGSKVVLPEAMRGDCETVIRLQRKRCQLHFAQLFAGKREFHQRQNMGLAHTALELLGVSLAASDCAMLSLAPDCCDFRVVQCGGAEFACAFSANDVASTESLFSTLAWKREATSLVFNHRRDRPGRFAAFLDWMRGGWQEVMIIGDPPGRDISGLRYLSLEGGGLQRLLVTGGKEVRRFFGCGNVAGYPLQFMEFARCHF